MTAHSPSERWFERLRAQPARWALIKFALTLLFALALWPLFEEPFSALFRAICSLTLNPLHFGNGGHASFSAASDATGLERASSWDVRMVLRIEGVEKAHAVALNPRRLLYLPLATLLASVLAMPLPRRARQRAFGVGVLVLLALALASVWLIGVFLFAQVPGLVYDLSARESSLLRLCYEGWVTPLTNKFLVPLLLGYGLYAWQRRAEAEGPAQPSDAKAGSAPPARSSKRKRSNVRPRKRAASAQR